MKIKITAKIIYRNGTGKKVTGTLIGVRTIGKKINLLLANDSSVYYVSKKHKIISMTIRSSYMSITNSPTLEEVKKTFDRYVEYGKIKLENGICNEHVGDKLEITTFETKVPDEEKEPYIYIIREKVKRAKEVGDKKHESSNSGNNS